MPPRSHPPLILLPPSEGKATGGVGAAWKPGTDAFAELDASRQQVMAALAKAMKGSLATRSKLLGVKGVALGAATDANRAVQTSATMAAIDRYTGVLYDAFDHAGLPSTARKRAGAQVVIFSGLFGLVTPTSPIPDYKLKMGAALPKFGRLASWWKPQLTRALSPRVDGRVVWDLLPNEHASAWNPIDTTPAARYTVKFLDDVGTGTQRRLVTVSHWNKLLKGALVRHVLTTQLTDPAGLIDFEHPEGYEYRPDLTGVGPTSTQLSFVARRSS